MHIRIVKLATETVWVSEYNNNAIFHNYIRQHEGLNGRKPSEACSIAIVENDK